MDIRWLLHLLTFCKPLEIRAFPVKCRQIITLVELLVVPIIAVFLLLIKRIIVLMTKCTQGKVLTFLMQHYAVVLLQ